MGKHLHKLFSTKEVKEVFERDLFREIGWEHALALLKIRRRQFFKLFKAYREDPDRFSLDYKRKAPPRKVDAKAEAGIIRELKKEARIIQDKSNPVKNYNYSYVREVLETKHKISVSLPTIISRAKNGFYHEKRFRKSHDREVLKLRWTQLSRQFF